MLRRLATGDEWWRPLPPGASADALRILAARGVRAFGDGFVALLLPIYLVERGFSALAVGTIVTGTLVGTALMTLWVGWIANRYSRPAAFDRGRADGHDRGGLRSSYGLLAASGHRRCRHDESNIGRCEHFCTARTDRAHRNHRAAAANRAVRALQRHRLLCHGAWRARGGISRLRHGMDRCSRSTAMQLMFGLYAFRARRVP